ncbi:MAG: AAA family ATPase [Leptospiraceae bacterium]|nr:AAA family ATPase [Leptospiraceae bacterium]
MNSFEFQDKIYESNNSVIFRVKQKSDNKPFIVKQPNNSSPDTTLRLKREFDILKDLKTPEIIEVYSLEYSENTLSLILEDFEATSLEEFLKSKKIDILTFLKIAIQVVKGLVAIHNKNIVHKDINPNNIVIHAESLQTKIIDFGIATTLSKTEQSLVSPEVIEGTLSYISPEQTGRMNRNIDYRTDFYSLGVTFYQMVTGRLPFELDDALDLIHSHIAILPEPPEKYWIPKAISEIILKLMSKNAEDRYMSAVGLLYDLEWCLENFQTLDTVSFQPGLRDVSLQFQIPEKVYGREEELEQLLRIYQQVTEGKTEILLVNGLSGIGKTVLVNEIQKPIVSSKGFYITGKFDPMKRNIPFRAIIYAFQDLVKLILTEKNESIELWKEKLQVALGTNGRVVTEVIPELELILGEQPELIELSPNESQNRFNLVFQDFVRVFASAEHPLVIFLDDLQWADSPSIHLIQTLYTATDISHLMFILAYRINEVDATHPFVLMVNDLRKQEFTIHEIALKPLSLEPINQLVSDSLKQKPDITKPLAEVVMSKTAGNPFFVNELLTNLYHRDLIYLKEEQWNWDLRKIQEANISKNVIDLLAEKAKELSKEVLETIQLISCIGSWFYIDMLHRISEKSEEEVKDSITNLVNGGFLHISKTKGRFVHDKVKEMVYGLVSDDDRKKYHYKIGKTYWEVAEQKNEIDENVFVIVNQLNNAIDLLTKEEKAKLLDLNLMAVDKAFASAAYEPALNLLKITTELLPDHSWETEYEKTLDVYTKMARLEYLNGNYDEAEKFFEIVLSNSKTELERVNVYEIKMPLFVAKFQFREALDIGLKGLEILGITFPEVHDPTFEFTKIFQQLGERKPEDLFNLPLSKEPYKSASMRLLSSCIVSSYVSLPSLLPIVIGKMINISLEHNNFPVSPLGYVFFGNITASVLGNYDLGYSFGKLAIDLLLKYNLEFLTSSVYMLFFAMVSHWKKHAKESLDNLLKGHNAGIKFGDIAWGSYCINHHGWISLYSRESLYNLNNIYNEHNKILDKLKQHDTTLLYKVTWQLIINLLGDSEDILLLKGEKFSETDSLEGIQQAKNFTCLYLYFTNKLVLSCFFGNLLDAYKYANEAIPFEGAMFGLMIVPEHNFFYSLSCIGLYELEKNHVYLNQVKKNQERMKVWAENCEANYGHKYLIVEAELARIEGNIVDAISKYDEAIKLAIRYEYTLEEAIANELAGKFWLSQKNEKFAKVCMIDARYAYERWGCKPKVKQLEETYHDLIGFNQNRRATDRRKISTTLTGGISDFSSSSTLIDIQSVLKASHTLSAEIELGKLLENMMKILFQNSGAETGKLILVEKVKNNHEVKMIIEAEGDANKKSISVMLHKTLEQVSLPHTILNYVERAKKEVVLDNASQRGMYTNDPYIKENRTKSVMCYPVVNQGKLQAIVYLENNLATGAFTEERVETLKILATQAAISIENARLYENIETITRDKTRIETEMSIAREIQTSLLPQEPILSGYELTVYMKMADEVGGDYYDVIRENGREWFLIGDASGHGVHAGLVMIMVQTSIHTVIESNPNMNPADLLKKVNLVITKNISLLKMNKYMTLTLFLKDTDGKLYYSGMHQDLVVYKSQTKKVETVETNGNWLGMANIMNEFPIEELSLEKGDVLFLYTDGVTEATDKDENQFDLGGLVKFMEVNGEYSVKTIKEKFLDTIRDYTSDDDITFMILKKSE